MPPVCGILQGDPQERRPRVDGMRPRFLQQSLAVV
jgi:hypothetical protein